MRDRPGLSDAAIVDALYRFYGLRVVNLAFLQLGYDASARVFRVDCADASYFLKVRVDQPRPAGTAAPMQLQQLGIWQAVAPIPTLNGDSFARTSHHWLVLFPWIHGESAWGKTLSRRQWMAWGKLLRQIHRADISPALYDILPREAFGEKWLPRFDRVIRALDGAEAVGEIASFTAATWRENNDAIAESRRRYINLGKELSAQSPALVLCHADIHQANLIIDASGRLRVVDWDEAILAPVERDLMFFVDDGHAMLKSPLSSPAMAATPATRRAWLITSTTG